MKGYPNHTKLLSLLLCFVLVLGQLPAVAAAEEVPCTLTEGCTGFLDAEGNCPVCSVPQPHSHSYVNGLCSCGSACSHETYAEGLCTLCGASEPVSCDHSWDEGTVTTAATCTAEGVMTFTCTKEGCVEIRTEPVAQTSHTYANGSCTVCGACEHSWDEGTVTVESTCAEKGTIAFTCIGCGQVRTASLAMGDHVFENGVCTGCGACEHSWDEGTVTVPATCTAEGTMTFSCTREGCEETKTETTEIASHTYDNGSCTVCGALEVKCICSVPCSETVNTDCPVCSAEGGLCTAIAMPAALYFSDQDKTWGSEIKAVYTDAAGNITEVLLSASSRGYFYSGQVPAGTVSFCFTDGTHRTQPMLISQVLELGTDMCVIFDGSEEWMEFATWSQMNPLAAVAKVGNTEYATIDEAIANWTNGTILTLLADVTLTEVIKLKSTEHHILNLDTYTLTAAAGQNAIEIVACGTGDSERTAITINADPTSPGGIDANNKSVIYYKYADGGISGNDRPIIKITGGVFDGSTSSGSAGIFTIGKAARQCATLNISGGIFNCSINGQNKSKMIISGGVFNNSVGSQGDQTCYRMITGGKFSSFGFMTADDNCTKFWIGTDTNNRTNYNVGVHVNDAGYLVVGGPVITEAGDKFEVSTNYSIWSRYLKYSSAKEHGLYWTSLETAMTKASSITLQKGISRQSPVTVNNALTIDTNGKSLDADLVLKTNNLTIIFPENVTPAWTVTTSADGKIVEYTDSVSNGNITRKYSVVNSVAKIGDTSYSSLETAVETATAGDTITLLADVAPANAITISKNLTIAASGKNLDADFVLDNSTLSITFPEGTVPTWNVSTEADGKVVGYTDTTTDGSVTRTYSIADPVVKIGDTGYASLENAISAANSATGSVTITLLDDVTLADHIAINADLVIDTNGHSFNATVDTSLTVLGSNGNEAMIKMPDGGTIQSSSDSDVFTPQKGQYGYSRIIINGKHYFTEDDGAYVTSAADGSIDFDPNANFVEITYDEAGKAVYQMTKAEDSLSKTNAFTQNSNSEILFISTGFYRLLTSVSVDGTTVGSDYYTSAPGSTYVTLYNAFLKTLSLGPHTLTMHYADGGYAICSFSVVASPYIADPTNPKTGDDFTMVLYSTMAMTSLLCLAALTLTRKKVF